MGTITNATPLTNGTTVSFDSSSADNYYSFTLNSAGNALFSGSDSNGYHISSLKIYNSSFALVDTVSYLTGGASKSLSAGTYYVQAVDSSGGSFSVSSPVMGTPALTPETPETPEANTQDLSTFVERLYANVLGRSSDTSGLANWVDALQTSNASDVAKSFFNSQEFLNANYSDTAYVQKLYSTFLDRTYDQGGLTHWLSQLSSGMSRSAVLDGFAQSSEFATIAQSYGIDAYESGGGIAPPSNSNLSPVESFVERFYTEVLGRSSDASGLDSWSAGLENGSKTADDIAQGFFFSQEFINRNLSNSDFIDVAYETLLNRQADSGGKSNWLAELNGGMSRSTMLDGFIYSSEFDTLADGYGIEVGIPPQPELPVDDTVTISDIDGRYNLLYADAEMNGVDIHLDASDVRGSYLNISSNGSVTQYVKYMGQSQTTTGTITEITDTTITINAYGEENEYSYSWNDPYLTTSVDIYESGVSYSETDHWILV